MPLPPFYLFATLKPRIAYLSGGRWHCVSHMACTFQQWWSMLQTAIHSYPTLPYLSGLAVIQVLHYSTVVRATSQSYGGAKILGGQNSKTPEPIYSFFMKFASFQTAGPATGSTSGWRHMNKNKMSRFISGQKFYF